MSVNNQKSEPDDADPTAEQPEKKSPSESITSGPPPPPSATYLKDSVAGRIPHRIRPAISLQKIAIPPQALFNVTLKFSRFP